MKYEMKSNPQIQKKNNLLKKCRLIRTCEMLLIINYK